ncbi:MAG: hypothetical protein AAGC60_16165 [Acidobacteriota bacterium]
MSRNKAFKQHAILCEGFDDRAFWSGWLVERLACTDPTSGGMEPARDAWGRGIQGRGRHFFRTPAGAGIIVEPGRGRSQLKRLAARYLGGLARSFDRVLINFDSDADAESVETDGEDFLRTIVLEHGGTENKGRFAVGATRVDAIVWRCDDPADTCGVPNKQTLERLACAAIVEAYTRRAEPVESWLSAEPRTSVDEKNYSFSYLAKWYADHGADDYWRALWRDEAIAEALEGRLEASGALEVVRELVAD